jgi:hypothetical protein
MIGVEYVSNPETQPRSIRSVLRPYLLCAMLLEYFQNTLFFAEIVYSYRQDDVFLRNVPTKSL